MAGMVYDGSGSRVVQHKGDIADTVYNIDPDWTPILTMVRKRTVVDPNPKVVTDSLASVDTSNYLAENAVAPSASDTTRALVENWCQIFGVTATATDTMNAVAQYGISKEQLYQEAKKMRELARDIEASCLSDQSSQAPTAANSRVAKQNGMTTIISSNTDAVGDFNQANFDTLVAAAVEDGGNPSVAYMDYTRKAAVVSWSTGVVTRYITDARQMISNVNYYESPMGKNIHLVWHYLMPQDFSSDGAHCMCLDPDLWELLTLRNNGLRRVKVAKTGLSNSTLLTGQLCIFCHVEDGNFTFY